MREIREILFRGLHRRKGEKVWLDGTPVKSKWVYGGVCQFKGERSIIYQIEPEITKFPVYTDTLGQFTGLYDSTKWESLPESEQKEWLKSHTANEWKGRRIFEGDIVEYPDKSRINNVSAGEVYFDTRFADYRVLLPEFYGFGVSRSLADIIDKAVVIGNIHDNPELLE